MIMTRKNNGGDLQSLLAEMQLQSGQPMKTDSPEDLFEVCPTAFKVTDADRHQLPCDPQRKNLIKKINGWTDGPLEVYQPQELVLETKDLQLNPEVTFVQDIWKSQRVVKCSVSQFLEVFIAQARDASVLDCSPESFECIHERLFEEICPLFDGLEFYSTSQKLKKRSKSAFKNFCKQNNCSRKDVLILLCLKDPVLDDEIVSYLKNQLTAFTKKPSYISRFLSFVGYTK